MSFCLVFFCLSPGDGGGLLRALYIVPIYMDTHGFQIGVCLWGLRAESVPGPSSPKIPSLWGGGGEGLGPGLGISLHDREDKYPPAPGHCPIWRKGGAVAPSPRPTTFPSPCPVWDGGEVANRFPGQHRGRLGWSAGLQSGGEGRSYAAHSHPISLGLSPAQPKAAPFGPTDLPAPL